MLIVLSPAKTLDFDTPSPTQTHTQPVLLNDAKTLVKQLKKMAPAELSSLMSISDKLGTLNFNRYHDWKTPFTANNAKQALLAFKGDVYTGLEADTFSAQDLKFAQKHLRILSGLYGVLKPLDLMQAYRLEMGTHLVTQKGENLYDFWGDKITELINADLKKNKSEALVNLASNEYFKSIQSDDLNQKVITPVFKDYKNGKYKIISFYAKKARGMMAAYVIRNRITDPLQIQNFRLAGYRYNKSESNSAEWVFKRKNPE